MKYAIQMSSSVMICIPSFMKIGSVIQNMIRGCTNTQTGWRSHKLTYNFSKQGKKAKHS
jgi:hypothetical protein